MFKHIPRKKVLLFLGDSAIIYGASLFSPFIRLGQGGFQYPHSQFEMGLITFIFLGVFFLSDLYDVNIRFRSARYLFRFMGAVLIASTCTVLAFFFFPELSVGRGIFMVNVALIGILTYAWRTGFEWYFKNFFQRAKKLLIFGAGWAGRTVYGIVKNNPSYETVGVLDDDPHKRHHSGSLNVLGGCDVLKELTHKKRSDVDLIIIAITHLKSQELLRSVLECKMNGVNVSDMSTFYEEVTGKIPVEHINDHWLVFTPLSGVRKSLYNLKIKRVLDITISIIGLVLSSPISILSMLAIKVETKGPVLYKQKRVGLNGEEFNLFKFRSMYEESEKEGAVWASKNDPRVTKVGRFIRRIRVDEIPQMWNVLKGQMSFIGPRPERPEFETMFNEKIPYYSLRYSVRPGITGWAQVKYPYGASQSDALEKLQFDLFYIKNLSPLLDFHILLKTVKVVFWGKGAR